MLLERFRKILTIYIWLCENKLKLNIFKTKFMILTRNRKNRDEYELKIMTDAFQRVNVIKYLGITILFLLNATQMDKVQKK